jgi:SAM-dependent methyltransferase
MGSSPKLPSLYGEFASWFHVLTPPEEYAVEAEFYGRLIEEHAEIPVKTILELGSGGGNNASHLKDRFDFTLVDLSEEMLELSRSINPECEHLVGDMTTLRLGREFDAAFIHDSICYMTSESDLMAALETAFVHCKAGGAAVFAPDYVRETLKPGTDHGGSDGPDRSMRYLEWVHEAEGDTYVVDYAYLLQEANGEVRVAQDRHVEGVFDRATWMRLIEEAGFRAVRSDGIPDETGEDVFIGVKPQDPA